MKHSFRKFNRLILIFLFLSSFMSVQAQYSPNAINFQAVARDNKGNVLVQKSLVVYVSILESSVNGTLVWKESQNVVTNNFGLFTLAIGCGNKVDGTATNLQSIDWGDFSHYLKVEIDFGDGEAALVGTTQMFAVPYALYAEKSGNSSADLSNVKFDSSTSILKNGTDTVANLTSLMQSLNFDATSCHLTISGSSGVVDLIGLKQDLRRDGDKIWMTGNTDPTVVNLSTYMQTLSLTTGGKIAISGGNSVSIDTSSLNEIQDLSLSSNTLKITKNSSATSIDLSKYLDDTDKQNLSRSGSSLNITNGTSVDVSDMINLTWTGFSGNNLSTQALLGAAESVVTWSEEFDSGNVLDNNKFTAPAAGYYSMSLNLILSSDSYLEIRIYKNSNVLRTFAAGTFGKSFSHTMLLSLAANDVITIKVYNSDSTPYYIKSGYFSGYRVN